MKNIVSSASRELVIRVVCMRLVFQSCGDCTLAGARAQAWLHDKGEGKVLFHVTDQSVIKVFIQVQFQSLRKMQTVNYIFQYKSDVYYTNTYLQVYLRFN